jgi:hypothetical protein
MGLPGAYRSDGQIDAFGIPFYGRLDVPALPPGVLYTAAAASFATSAALRSDGRLVVWGNNGGGQHSVPPLPPGTSYTAASLGFGHVVALRSDGVALAWGSNQWGQCNLPALTPGLSYIDVAASEWNTVLLRSDGQILVAGLTSGGMQQVPPLPPGLVYTDVTASRTSAAAIRSDGSVVEWGGVGGIWWIPRPVLPPGVHFVQIAGGDTHFAGRSSDGQAHSWGSIPSTPVPVHLVPAVGKESSYLDVDAGDLVSVGLVGRKSTFVTFAAGCSGSAPAAMLVPRDTPQIGKTLVVQLEGVPQNLALVGLGWQRVAPVSLAPFGAPGCFWHVSPDALVPVAGAGGRARIAMPIPFAMSLFGIEFHQQALVLDASSNALGATVSAAATGSIGG